MIPGQAKEEERNKAKKKKALDRRLKKALKLPKLWYPLYLPDAALLKETYKI